MHTQTHTRCVHVHTEPTFSEILARVLFWLVFVWMFEFPKQKPALLAYLSHMWMVDGSWTQAKRMPKYRHRNVIAFIWCVKQAHTYTRQYASAKGTTRQSWMRVCVKCMRANMYRRAQKNGTALSPKHSAAQRNATYCYCSVSRVAVQRLCMSCDRLFYSVLL